MPIESKSSSNITNNITIRNCNKVESGDVSCPSMSGVEVKYPDAFGTTQEKKTIEFDSVSEYLLSLYKSILLSEDRKLLSNLVSKNSIILTKEDLEEVVKRKVGKECKVLYEDPEVTCCGMSMNIPFMKISSIRVYDDERPNGVDFKVVHNTEYLELVTVHNLCTEFVLAN